MLSSIRSKAVIFTTLIVFLTSFFSVAAVIFINISQIKKDNHSKLQSAVTIFARNFDTMPQMLNERMRTFMSDEDLATHILQSINAGWTLELGLSFTGDFHKIEELLLNNSDIDRFAFYFSPGKNKSETLALYHNNSDDGIVMVEGEKHYKKLKFGRKEIENNHLYPEELIYAQGFSLRAEKDGMFLVAQYPYELDQGATSLKNHIGYFIAEHSLSLDLANLGEDLGVRINIFDAEGKMGEGKIDFESLDIKKLSVAENKFLEMEDAGGNSYDALILPLSYDSKNLGYVSVSIPHKETTDQIIQEISLLFIISIGVLLFVTPLSWILVSRWSAPIIKLMHAASQISKGNLDQKIEISSKDELGNLARSFAEMRDSIRKTIRSLKKQENELRAHRERLEELVKDRTLTLDKELAYRKKSELRITKWSHLQSDLLDNRSLSDKLQSVTHGMVDIFDADFARIWVVRPGDICEKNCVHADFEIDGVKICRDRSACLHLVASSGRYTHLDGEHGRQPFSAYKIGRLIAEGHAHFLTNDVLHDPQIADHEWARSIGLTSFAGYGLFSTKGQPMGAIGLFFKRPIDKQKENHLKGVAAMISQVIQAGRAEKALLVAKQEAEAATTAKGDFLARMSHEIRTPMNAVIGLTHLALRTDLSSKQLDYMRKIRGSSQALLGIINDILDFSKIEAGKLSLENIVFDLRDVFDNLTNIVTVKSEEKGLELLYEIDRNIPEKLKGDPLRLGQVLINLAGNAVKFTDRGEVIISMHLTGRGGGVASILFAVRDTGVGINEDQLAELFASFSQADATVTRRYGGTGLGLSISKQLVEMMDGTMEVESKPGKGTTFSFSLQFKEIDEKIQHQDLLVPAEIKGKKVLIVDDNRASRHILRSMLEDFSFKVVTAGSGYEAIKIIENHLRQDESFDIILMDWRMPGINGIDTALRIKNDTELKQTPFILMVTAYSREEVDKKAQQAGLDGFLTKPVNASILLNTILELFGYQSMQPKEQNKISNVDQKELAGIQGANILIVEDNAINRQVATEFLEQLSMNVDTAVNGVEGVEKACRAQYDLILMDIQMPEMDGLEATRSIRERGLVQLPIVAMTAHAMDRDRELSREAGLNDHLTKPVNPVELEEMLVKWISPENRMAIPEKRRNSLRENGDIILPQIDGLDPHQGVIQVGGYASMYLRLLEEFALDNLEITIKLQQEINREHWDSAQGMVHSITGTSSTLGAEIVARIAGDLQKAIDAREQEKIKELLPLFSSCIISLCQQVLEFFSKQKAANPELPRVEINTSPDNVITRLDTLASYLETGNSLAEDLGEELRQQLKELGLEKDYNVLMANIEDVEFEDAQKIVKKISLAIREEI